ncbi:MAG: hypothetical protein ACK6D4_22600 [Planctomyces sp.]
MRSVFDFSHSISGKHKNYTNLIHMGIAEHREHLNERNFFIMRQDAKEQTITDPGRKHRLQIGELVA